MIAPRSNLIAASKLSNYQIKKIIRQYAYGIPPTAASRGMNVSRHTVGKIYGLIRSRMEQLGLYPVMPDLKEFIRTYYRYAPPRSPQHAFIHDRMQLRRGALPHDDGAHISEVYFWSLKPPNWSHERYAERHRVDIIRLVQLTGPLNRPVPTERLVLARSYLDQRRL